MLRFALEMLYEPTKGKQQQTIGYISVVRAVVPLFCFIIAINFIDETIQSI